MDNETKKYLEAALQDTRTPENSKLVRDNPACGPEIAKFAAISAVIKIMETEQKGLKALPMNNSWLAMGSPKALDTDWGMVEMANYSLAGKWDLPPEVKKMEEELKAFKADPLNREKYLKSRETNKETTKIFTVRVLPGVQTE